MHEWPTRFQSSSQPPRLLAGGLARAQTFVVIKRGDPAPDACKKRYCSLCEAVRAAHERPGADVIELPNARRPYSLRFGGIDEDNGLVGDLDQAPLRDGSPSGSLVVVH